MLLNVKVGSADNVALEETEKAPRPHFASTFDGSWDDYNDQIRSAGSSHDVNAATSSHPHPMSWKAAPRSPFAHPLNGSTPIAYSRLPVGEVCFQL